MLLFLAWNVYLLLPVSRLLLKMLLPCVQIQFLNGSDIESFPTKQMSVNSYVFAASNSTSDSHKRGNRMHVALIILIIVLVSTVLILGLIAAYKYWQKKKREQDQARFLKLFEEGDDIEDELGLGIVI